MIRAPYIYEDVSRNKVQVSAGGHGLPVSRAIRQADVPTLGTKSTGKQTCETFTHKKSKEFCFCSGIAGPETGTSSIDWAQRRVSSPKRCFKFKKLINQEWDMDYVLKSITAFLSWFLFPSTFLQQTNG
jgi:hypothetical protein